MGSCEIGLMRKWAHAKLGSCEIGLMRKWAALCWARQRKQGERCLNGQSSSAATRGRRSRPVTPVHTWSHCHIRQNRAPGGTVARTWRYDGPHLALRWPAPGGNPKSLDTRLARQAPEHNTC
eukprot:107952-Chlamydomonas_euryale.AAC.1